MHRDSRLSGLAKPYIGRENFPQRLLRLVCCRRSGVLGDILRHLRGSEFHAPREETQKTCKCTLLNFFMMPSISSAGTAGSRYGNHLKNITSLPKRTCVAACREYKRANEENVSGTVAGDSKKRTSWNLSQHFTKKNGFLER